MNLKINQNKPLNVLDVRKDGEYLSMHLEGDHVQHFALDYINQEMEQIDTPKPTTFIVLVVIDL